MTPTPPPAPVPAPRDDLCLAFANTRYWRGSAAATETLNAPSDLLDWAAAAGGADPGLLADLRERWRARPEDAADGFTLALHWREALYAVVAAVTDRAEPSASDIAELNDALARAPARGRVQRLDDRFAWAVPATAGVEALLAPVLWSAGDLLTGTRLGRVRRCANERCRWVFLDDSKSANRRWCSMSACGNRAKAHRHYVRRKQG
jgi:predicted RNA-binding Zn ribbon-like protein